MDDDLLSEESVEEGKVDLLSPPEVMTPPGAENFSMRAQQDKFLGGMGPEFNRRSREETALDKVRDITEKTWSHRTEVKKLGDVLREGVISPKLANRIDSQSFEHSTNPHLKDSDTWWSKNSMIYRDRRSLRRTDLGEHFEYVAILRDAPPLEEEGRTWETRDDFAVIPRRVAPKEFAGILIPDQRVEKFGRRLGEAESRDLAISEAQWIAQSHFSNEFSLPIYGTSGDLLWPQYIPNKDLATVQPQAKAA